MTEILVTDLFEAYFGTSVNLFLVRLFSKVRLIFGNGGYVISGNAIVYHNEAFYVFGGGNLDKIGRFDGVTRVWSLAGTLKSSRKGHSVIYDGIKTFLVIGGEGNKKTENCVLNGEVISCTEQNNSVSNYASEPALFLTFDNYADDC